MSRSYKRTPIIKSKSKSDLIASHRKLRKQKDVPNGKMYKKFYSGYDITEDVWYFSWKSYKERYLSIQSEIENCGFNRRNTYGNTLYECFIDWQKTYCWK